MRSAVSLKTILLGIAVIVVSFGVSLTAMNWLAPRGATPTPELAQLPPLPAISRNSLILVPVAIALAAIRDAADRGSPRTFAGKADNPVSELLQNADIALDRVAWPDLRDRRPGCAVAGNATDRKTQCDGLAILKGNRCGQRCAGRVAGRQCRQTDRQLEHQVAQRERRDKGQRYFHLPTEARRGLAS